MSEPIYVHFIQESQKVDKDFVGKIVRFMDDWSKNKTDQACSDLKNTILIARTGAASNTKKVSYAPTKQTYCVVGHCRLESF